MVDTELLCRIIKWLKHEKREPLHTDFKVPKEMFGYAVETLVHLGLIERATVLRGGYGNKVQLVMLNRSKVTEQGKEFLATFFPHELSYD